MSVINSATTVNGSSGTLTLQTSGTNALSIDSNQNATFNSTGAVTLPVGTTAQEPGTPATGMVRFNSTLTRYEGYNGTVWKPIGGGATGGGSDEIFYNNGQTVTTNYAIPAGLNSVSAGPITINAGITVTIPAGSNWSVV